MKQQQGFSQQIQQVAQNRLGFTQLQPGQQAALEHVLAGRDTLVVMPTGAGKSAIYQIAAYLLPGATVVVSPLIALQQDQVDALKAVAIGDAAAINSTIPSSERAEMLEQVEQAALEFIFLAPEQ